MENSKNKQFISFKLHTILSSVMKSCAVLLHPAWVWIIPLSSLFSLYTLPVWGCRRKHCICIHRIWYSLWFQTSTRVLECIPVLNGVCAKSLQSCLTVCDPMDCSLPDSSVHGILQTIILKWFAISSSRGWIFLTQELNPCLLRFLLFQNIIYHFNDF